MVPLPSTSSYLWSKWRPGSHSAGTITMTTSLCTMVKPVVVLRWVMAALQGQCFHVLESAQITQLHARCIYDLFCNDVSWSKSSSAKRCEYFCNFQLQNTQNHFFAESVLIQAALLAISATLAAYCCKVVNCCAPAPKMVSYYHL